MVIDTLRTDVVPLEVELARKALEIAREPFPARYLRKVKRIAISRAPVRLDSGGWSDCWWFLDRYPGFVCNLALALYSYVVAIVFDRPGVEPTYHALDLEDESESGLIRELEGKFVHQAVTHFPGVFDSLETHIIVNTMAPPNAGLGSSGSVGVATVALLSQLAGQKMSRREITVLAHSIEHSEMGHESGTQDQIAAAHGGVSSIEMPQGSFPDKFSWSSLILPPGMEQQVESGLLLVNTGEKRDSRDEHARKIAIIQAGGEGAQEALDHIVAIAEAAKQVGLSFEQGDWAGVCEAFGDNWKHQVALDPRGETDTIKFITRIAQRNGAMVKVGGAAYGGVMGVFCRKGRRQRDEISREIEGKIFPIVEGASFVPTKIATKGVEVCIFTTAELKQLAQC